MPCGLYIAMIRSPYTTLKGKSAETAILMLAFDLSLSPLSIEINICIKMIEHTVVIEL